MTGKRFKLHIGWFNYDKTEGSATLSDNGQPLLECECVGDMRRVKELLNELNDENDELRIQYNNLREQRNEFHRGVRENANRVGKLERENKELQNENEQLKFDKQELHIAMSIKEVKHKQFKNKVFDLIDEKIKELSTTNKYGDIHEDLRIFTQQILLDLKKEVLE